ncbi:MAG: hypothetical protein WHT07_04275 [Desulfobaccales bacterium]
MVRLKWLGALLLVLALATMVGAQEALKSPFDYNPATVQTHRGWVISVTPVAPGPIPQMVTVQLATQQETLTVWLAPSWFLEAQGFKVTALDRLEVTGSRLVVDGRPLLLTATVKKNGQTLRLRDEKGNPLWSRRPPGP